MSNDLKFGKADLHIHSEYSHDAFPPVKSILKFAKKRGLDVIAVTDHNTIAGAKEAQKIAKDFDIEVILGEEIDVKEGDLLALFINKFIVPGKPALTTIREIHKQGGLAVVPHPANWVLGGMSTRSIFKIFHELDGIELFNASIFGVINQKRFRRLNMEIFNLAQTSSSDAHLARAVGRGYTIFQGHTPSDLYNAIKNKTTRLGGDYWSFWDNIMWLVNSPKRVFKDPDKVRKELKEIIEKGKDINQY